MPVIKHDQISQIIREVAAEKIVPRFQQLEEGHIRAKSNANDLVTIADEEAEIELTRILTDVLPGSLVIGEEAVSSGKVVREILEQSDDYIWIVDPVDGTHNFAHGKPIFGTMVALLKGGERLASWIYQIPDERMVLAVRGEGAQINGMHLSPPPKPAPDADFSTMKAFISRMFMPASVRPYVDKQVEKMADASTYRCCAWEYVELAEGKRAFSVYKRIEPWDHMAGVLLLEETGFFVRKWDKSIYGGRDLSGGLVNAPSEALWDRAKAAFVFDPATIKPL